VCCFPVLCSVAVATEEPERVTKEAAIIENLEQFVDLELKFIDEDGQERPLGSYITNNRPVIITPVYYECPNLCTLTLNGLVETLNELDLELGTDFNVLSVTINPREDAALAKEKSLRYYKELEKPEHGMKGWRFLTGTPENITSIMGQLGFVYAPDGKEFMHTAAIMILTPKGKIARYFYGVQYDAKNVRYALVEAAEGRIGTTLDRVFLYCFSYNPLTGKYSPMIWNITRAICMIVVGLLAGGLILMRLRERAKRRKS
jgi:protein SCO1/2